MFPDKDVRFIAINDGVDSERDDNDFTPFRNIINGRPGRKYANDRTLLSSHFLNAVDLHSLLDYTLILAKKRQFRTSFHLLIHIQHKTPAPSRGGGLFPLILPAQREAR